MKPQNNHIQIEFTPAESGEVTTSSGLIIHQEADATEEGKVIHGGESSLDVGTMVLFKSYSLITFKNKLHFVKMEDVIAAYVPSV